MVVGDYEEEAQEKLEEFEKETVTDSLADSSYFGFLGGEDDMVSFQEFYERPKKKREIEKIVGFKKGHLVEEQNKKEFDEAMDALDD